MTNDECLRTNDQRLSRSSLDIRHSSFQRGFPMNIDIPTGGGGLPFVPQVQRYRDYARQRQITLADLLLEHRIIFVGSAPETGGHPEISDFLANVTIQKLLYLQYENKNQEIHMYINCPGGSVTATLAIYDTMQF